jgi:DNA-binding transcriptional regulator/RsmH inhibitor MraZ
LAQLFTGSFLRNLDGKNRLLVPSEIRDALDAADRKGLFLIPSTKCVFLWPQSYLEAYSSQQGADPFGNLGFNRTFYSQMIFKAFDGTGRIVLPGELAARFPDREVLIAGAGRYLELWEPRAFEEAVSPLELE